MTKILSLLAIILFLVAVGLEVLNINMSSKLASDSVSVKKIQNNIASLNEENQILNSEVLDHTSFENISQKASILGFVQDHAYVFLRDQVKLSYSQ